MQKNIIGILIALVVLLGVAWIARPTTKDSTASLSPSAGSGGLLSVEGSADYDFGTISMAKGDAKHLFKIKNTGVEAVVINKMYTSCMCTTATIDTGDKKFGPYGMPGHGLIPKINEVLNPQQEAEVEVVFDPTAHGPAGVGRIERVVVIENNAGEPLELRFTATVTP